MAVTTLKRLLCLGTPYQDFGWERRFGATLAQPTARVTIGANAFPHILESIFRSATADASAVELKTLRSVSKKWRDLVDDILGKHLILDARVKILGNVTYLHDGHRAPIASDFEPCSFLAWAKRQLKPSPIAIPVLSHTKILDIRCINRTSTLEKLLQLLPLLNTLRLYPQKVLPLITTLPPARRVVVFLDLTHDRLLDGATVKPISPVPGMEELVLNLYRSRWDIWPDIPLTALYDDFGLEILVPKKVTIVLHVNENHRRDDLFSWYGMIFEIRLAQLVKRLPEDVEITIIGLETIVEHPSYKRHYDWVQVGVDNTFERVAFINLGTYQRKVGLDTWALYSEMAPVRVTALNSKANLWLTERLEDSGAAYYSAD